MTEHTPTPWRILPEEVDKDYIRIRGTVLGCRYKIANVLTPVYDGAPQREADETRANADLIVRACNAHDDLVDALERMIDGFGYTSYISDEEKQSDPDVIFAQNTLAKAKAVQS
ncbi:hypothetical protein [Dyadobacter bucti]|uniref:hypothetical protein n=1 Tax=Dyadobacter bucti TaxID=2572203 RepID=UPI001108D93C|nr:hypothetical protein [Dyadobacter bucti]